MKTISNLKETTSEECLDTRAVREEAVTDTKELNLEKWELVSCDKKVKR